MQGLLGNPVIQGLLTDPNTLRARARQEAAQMMPRAGGGMIGAPSPQQPQDSGWANALSSIGNSGAKLIEGLQANKASQKRVQSVLGMGNESRNAAMQAGGGPSNAAAAQMQVNPAQRLAQIGVPEKAQGLVMGAIEAGDWRTADQILTQFALTPAAERKVIKGADGYNYYQDTRERVLPGVKMAGDPNKPFNPDGTPNPAYMDYQRALRESGRTSVNVGSPNVYVDTGDKELARSDNAYFDTALESGNAARQSLNNYNMLLDLADKGALTGGGTAQLAVQDLLGSFGLDNWTKEIFGQSGVNLSAFNSILSREVLTKQLAQKGPQTESDARRLQTSIANIDAPEDANRLLLTSARAAAGLDVLERQFAVDYQKNNDSLKGLRAAWQDVIGDMPFYTSKGGSFLFWDKFVDRYMQKNDVGRMQAIQAWKKFAKEQRGQ